MAQYKRETPLLKSLAAVKRAQQLLETSRREAIEAATNSTIALLETLHKENREKGVNLPWFLEKALAIHTEENKPANGDPTTRRITQALKLAREKKTEESTTSRIQKLQETIAFATLQQHLLETEQMLAEQNRSLPPEQNISLSFLGRLRKETQEFQEMIESIPKTKKKKEKQPSLPNTHSKPAPTGAPYTSLSNPPAAASNFYPLAPNTTPQYFAQPQNIYPVPSFPATNLQPQPYLPPSSYPPHPYQSYPQPPFSQPPHFVPPGVGHNPGYSQYAVPYIPQKPPKVPYFSVPPASKIYSNNSATTEFLPASHLQNSTQTTALTSSQLEVIQHITARAPITTTSDALQSSQSSTLSLSSSVASPSILSNSVSSSASTSSTSTLAPPSSPSNTASVSLSSSSALSSQPSASSSNVSNKATSSLPTHPHQGEQPLAPTISATSASSSSQTTAVSSQNQNTQQAQVPQPSASSSSSTTVERIVSSSVTSSSISSGSTTRSTSLRRLARPFHPTSTEKPKAYKVTPLTTASWKGKTVPLSQSLAASSSSSSLSASPNVSNNPPQAKKPKIETPTSSSNNASQEPNPERKSPAPKSELKKFRTVHAYEDNSILHAIFGTWDPRKGCLFSKIKGLPHLTDPKILVEAWNLRYPNAQKGIEIYTVTDEASQTISLLGKYGNAEHPKRILLRAGYYDLIVPQETKEEIASFTITYPVIFESQKSEYHGNLVYLEPTTAPSLKTEVASLTHALPTKTVTSSTILENKTSQKNNSSESSTSASSSSSSSLSASSIPFIPAENKSSSQTQVPTPEAEEKRTPPSPPSDASPSSSSLSSSTSSSSSATASATPAETTQTPKQKKKKNKRAKKQSISTESPANSASSSSLTSDISSSLPEKKETPVPEDTEKLTPSTIEKSDEKNDTPGSFSSVSNSLSTSNISSNSTGQKSDPTPPPKTQVPEPEKEEEKNTAPPNLLMIVEAYGDGDCPYHATADDIIRVNEKPFLTCKELLEKSKNEKPKNKKSKNKNFESKKTIRDQDADRVKKLPMNNPILREALKETIQAIIEFSKKEKPPAIYKKLWENKAFKKAIDSYNRCEKEKESSEKTLIDSIKMDTEFFNSIEIYSSVNRPSKISNQWILDALDNFLKVEKIQNPEIQKNYETYQTSKKAAESWDSNFSEDLRDAYANEIIGTSSVHLSDKDMLLLAHINQWNLKIYQRARDPNKIELLTSTKDAPATHKTICLLYGNKHYDRIMPKQEAENFLKNKNLLQGSFEACTEQLCEKIDTNPKKFAQYSKPLEEKSEIPVSSNASAALLSLSSLSSSTSLSSEPTVVQQNIKPEENRNSESITSSITPTLPVLAKNIETAKSLADEKESGPPSEKKMTEESNKQNNTENENIPGISVMEFNAQKRIELENGTLRIIRGNFTLNYRISWIIKNQRNSSTFKFFFKTLDKNKISENLILDIIKEIALYTNWVDKSDLISDFRSKLVRENFKAIADIILSVISDKNEILENPNICKEKSHPLIALQVAAANNKIKTVEQILKIYPDLDRNISLFFAIYNFHLEAANILVKEDDSLKEFLKHEIPTLFKRSRDVPNLKTFEWICEANKKYGVNLVFNEHDDLTKDMNKLIRKHKVSENTSLQALPPPPNTSSSSSVSTSSSSTSSSNILSLSSTASALSSLSQNGRGSKSSSIPIKLLEEKREHASSSMRSLSSGQPPVIPPSIKPFEETRENISQSSSPMMFTVKKEESTQLEASIFPPQTKSQT